MKRTYTALQSAKRRTGRGSFAAALLAAFFAILLAAAGSQALGIVMGAIVVLAYRLVASEREEHVRDELERVYGQFIETGRERGDDDAG
jgi:hypothetical protein